MSARLSLSAAYRFLQQLLPGFQPIVRRVALQRLFDAAFGDKVSAQPDIPLGWLG